MLDCFVPTFLNKLGSRQKHYQYNPEWKDYDQAMLLFNNLKDDSFDERAFSRKKETWEIKYIRVRGGGRSRRI